MSNSKLMDKVKKPLSIILSFVFIISTFVISPIIANAVSTPVELESTAVNFWADPENAITQADLDSFNAGTKTTMTGAVGVFTRSTSSTNYYLFLPSDADCTNLRIWFNASLASVDSVSLTSGETTDVFSEINDGGVSKSYTLELDGTSYSLTAIKSGDVGAVYIDTSTGSMSSVYSSEDHSVSQSGTIMVIDADGKVNYDGSLEKIQGRGNGTWSDDTDESTNKKPFNIKLGVSTSLLGMNKAKKWCLLANTVDDTLIKDQLTYDFSDYIGIKYQPHCKPVDLYVNQQYYGSYQLSEKVEIKSNRVDITDAYENLEIANGTTDSTGTVTPADLTGTSVSTYNSSGQTVSSSSSSIIGGSLSSNTTSYTVGNRRYSKSLTDISDNTGGYIYELEISQRWVEEGAGFCGYNRQGWVIKSCDYATQSMVNYSYNLLYALGSSVYNSGTVPSTSTTTTTSKNTLVKTTTNPAPESEYQGKKWSDLLDADSAVRYYWTQEYFKNMDSSTSSTYFYKDSDSVDSMLYAGPVWDMDNTIFYNTTGSRWGCDLNSPEGWYTKNARIYRFRASDSTTTYSSDNYSPLNFYAALSTNCSDFWSMAENYWYSVIEPATQILLGNAEDPSGVLHSTEYYVSTVAKSSAMNNLRFNLNSDNAYDTETVVSGLNDWFSQRSEWISSQISTVDIADATVTVTSSYSCTGSQIEPEYTVTYDGVTLVEGTDFTAEYSNNIAASKTAVITLTGKGRYTGTKTVNFTIGSGTLVGGSVEINESAYSGDTLTAVVKNSSGDVISNYVSYQWKLDGTAIDGATSAEYTVTDSDRGKTLSVTVSGDGTNISSMSITSNDCAVSTSDKQYSYTQTIAAWDYDYATDSSALTEDSTSTDTYRYVATSGENMANSYLSASVNATDSAQIKWSGTSDLYTNTSNSTSSAQQAPVMGTSKTNSLAWGEYPYFLTTVSTLGFENIKFTAKIGGTKKAPRDWKLQYSLDGTTYTDISSSYSITQNKTMETAFEDVSLPSECDNKSAVYIRMIVCNNIAINSTNTIVNQTSGDAAVNNIAVTGSSTSSVTSLDAPSITTSSDDGDTLTIFDSNSVIITDNNGGADVYYTVDDSDETLYSEQFNPFDSSSAKAGDTVTVTAWAEFNSIKSQETQLTVTYGGVNVVSFDYSDYSQNVSNGAVFSTGGVYDESCKMTASTDGNSQYVPLWNDDKGAYSVSPDDGALWSSTSGFTFEVSTAGYTQTAFTCKAYTTSSGPKSVSLQYSLDGSTWTDVVTNEALSASSALEQTFMTVSLPEECDNNAKIYLRLATAEDSTFSGETLHSNLSKGNLYINDITVSGNDNGQYKMPYTNKTSDYFGTGAIKYVSYDNTSMQYIVTDADSNVLMSGTYPSSTGIVISSAEDFDSTVKGEYTVTIWAGDSDDKSVVNTRKYYYKGDTITKFSYNDSSRLLSDYLSDDGLTLSNTSGTNSATLSMYPDPSGVSAASLTYTNKYGVKVSWAANNKFTASGVLDNPDSNGYWLITASTLGYTDLTLNLEQLSSNKGPRDWGLAYSLDGTDYTYIASSNVRAISNDSASSTVETYNNFALPEECDNQSTVYIKVFINGAEAVNGDELSLLTEGNTGINAIELSGIPTEKLVDVTISTYGINNISSELSDVYADCNIEINGNEYTTSSGSVTVQLAEGKTYTVTASADSSFKHSVSVKASQDASVSIGVVCIDMNDDGVINVKDSVYINRMDDGETKDAYLQMFKNLINIKDDTFIYSD